jgi:Zn-dependent metalloprotease
MRMGKQGRKFLALGSYALLLGAGCGKVFVGDGANAECIDVSALQFRDSLSLSTPSRVPVVAHKTPAGRLTMVRGDFDAPGANLPDAARSFLDTERASLRIAPGFSWGEPVLRQGKAGVYLSFQPSYQGVKVYDGAVTVQLREEGATRRIRSLSLDLAERFSPREPAQWAEESAVLRAALDAVGAESIDENLSIERVALQDQGEGRFAYLVRFSSMAPSGDFDVLLDAESGAPFEVKNRRRFADGSALIFDPSPVGSTGNTNLADSNDTANAALNNARVSRTLLELDGTGVLRGPFVDARPTNAGQRATAADLVFNFDRADNRFEEVMAYFHIDRAQRRIQALGFNDVNNRRQVAIANGIPDDNSFYSPGTLQITFGTGGVDDAEDADIIVHEYGHSVQDNQGLGFGGDSGALGEGFGDFLASAVADSTSGQVSDPFCVGDWDATSYDNRNPPCLRRVDEGKHFPESLVDQIHADGEIWSATLFDLRAELGADVTDTLAIEANFSLGGSPTFERAAEALVAADEDLFAGEHADVVRRVVTDRGLLRELTPGLVEAEIAETIPQDLDLCVGSCPSRFDADEVISVPGAFGLRLNFTGFDTEDRSSCFEGGCDNVYLYDGQGRLFAVLNGELGDFSSVAIPGDTVRVRVVTDASGASAGFVVSSVDVLRACE